MSPDTILVGAVAYHPRIVTIWEGFRDHFAAHGAPTDYLLYSNYERLVQALLSGAVDIAWNTNTAYVVAEERIGGDARVLGMRDVDADFRTVIVARRGERFEDLPELAGRRLALGSRDSGHAAILPLHYLAHGGVEASALTLVRFDTDLGKHGDTGDSELRVVRAVAEGEADAGAVGDATWAAMRTEGFAPAGVRVRCSITSSLRTRPPGPVGATWDASIAFCSITRRAEGMTRGGAAEGGAAPLPAQVGQRRFGAASNIAGRKMR